MIILNHTTAHNLASLIADFRIFRQFTTPIFLYCKQIHFIISILLGTYFLWLYLLPPDTKLLWLLYYVIDEYAHNSQ